MPLQLKLNCVVLGDEISVFQVKIASTETVGDLKDVIKEKKKLALQCVDAHKLKIFKVSFPDNDSLAAALEDFKSKQKVSLRASKPLDEAFPDPINEHVHVIVEFRPTEPLPQEETDADKDGLQDVDRRVLYEDEITFTIPSREGFPNLKKSDLNSGEVEEAYGIEFPSFITEFREALFRRRALDTHVEPDRTSTLVRDLAKFHLRFETYFERQTGPVIDGGVAKKAVVKDKEILQYQHALVCQSAFSTGRFTVAKEGQVGIGFLHLLADELISRGGEGTADLTSWPFPLMASVSDPNEAPRKYRYTPRSGFSLKIKGFPHCILEAVSCDKTSLDEKPDLWRMMLQASCLARLGNRLRKDGADHPVVIMAIYIDSDLRAYEYLVYQPDVSSRKVLYHRTSFDLTNSAVEFKFIFRLYNFLSRAVEDNGKLGPNLSATWTKISSDILQNPTLTSKTHPSKPKTQPFLKRKDRDDDGTDAPGQRQVLDHLQEILKAAGYWLTPTGGMLQLITRLKPTMRDATARDGSRVVLKLVDDDTDELKILQRLNEFKSPANHTIELHGTVDVAVAKVMALRYRTPLDDYFRRDPPASAASFPDQFLEGVAFLHEKKVAHLDLEPGNVVVDGVNPKRPPRLLIIDFGLSIFVENEDTTIEGFCGTPSWVAPEVGKYDGPKMKYSPILADRWACGKMMYYLEKLSPGGGDGRPGRVPKMDELMSNDPRSRPPLNDVLKAYRGCLEQTAEKRSRKAEQPRVGNGVPDEDRGHLKRAASSNGIQTPKRLHVVDNELQSTPS